MYSSYLASDPGNKTSREGMNNLITPDHGIVRLTHSAMS